MLTCPRCGYYNSDIATQCEQCNTRISAANAEQPRHAGAPVPVSTPEAPPLPSRDPEYGDLYIRLIAATIDAFVLAFGIIFVARLLPILSAYALFLIPALYEIITEAQSGATLGKRVFNLRVVTADTLQPISVRRSIVRHFAHYLSVLPFSSVTSLPGLITASAPCTTT